MFTRKFYFDKGEGANGGGGDSATASQSGKKLTLADLDDDSSNGGGEPAKPLIEGGGGEPVRLEQEKAKIEAEQKELETLHITEKRTDEEEKRYQDLLGNYQLGYVDAEGKPLSGEEVEKLKKIEQKVEELSKKEEKDLTAEEKTFLEEHAEWVEEEEKDTRTVFEKASEISGITVNVDYGDVKPDSPEGIAKRDAAILKEGAELYAQQIKQKAPRAYQFLEHVQKGLPETDFFKPENNDFLSINLKKGDLTQAEQVLRTALDLKGNKPAQIDAIITAAKDSGTLEVDAKDELEALQSKQKKDNEVKELEAAQAKEHQNKAIGTLKSIIKDTVLDKGKIGNAIIPVQDRQAFHDYLQQDFRYIEGSFYSVAPITDENLENAFKTAYFRFKGGDLEALGERKAETKRIAKLKKSISFQVMPKGAGDSNRRRQPLGAI